VADKDAEIKSVRDQVAALTTLTVWGKQIRDITAREAVLRSLVQHVTPVSQEKYDEMYARALAQFDAAFSKIVSDATTLHNDERCDASFNRTQVNRNSFSVV
jgi:TRAP-type mannitol/chloroaromatic compound transport system substrate-binding protein